MSIKKDIMVSVGAGFLILVLYSLVIWLPHHKRISQANEAFDTVSVELDAELTKAAVLTELNSNVRDMMVSIEQLDKHLVPRSELSVLLRKFSAELRRLGIENQTIHTQSPQAQSHYTAIPLKLNFQGQYSQIDVFLRYMENLNYPIFVSDMSMRRNPRGEDQLIAVDLQLMIYFAPDGGESS